MKTNTRHEMVMAILICLCLIGILSGCLSSSGGEYVTGSITQIDNTEMSGYLFVPNSFSKAKISPKVTVPAGMKALADATVSVRDSGESDISDSNGYYSIMSYFQNDATKTLDVKVGSTTIVSFDLQSEKEKKNHAHVKITGTTGNYTVSELLIKSVPFGTTTEIVENELDTIDGEDITFSGLAAIQDLGTGGTIKLTWTAATHSDTPITYHVFMTTTSGSYNYSTPSYTVSGSTEKTISGLDHTPYYFVVRAETDHGKREFNTEEKNITPMTVPTAPQTLVATAGVESVGLVWVAPTSDGGADITD